MASGRRWKLEYGSPLEKPQEPPRIPELELTVAIRIFKDRYGVFIEPVAAKPYYVRFRQLQTDLTIQGMTHGKGTKLNPRFIIQILERFQIGIPDFLEAVVSARKGPQSL